jgi:hypothetical protein
MTLSLGAMRHRRCDGPNWLHHGRADRRHWHCCHNKATDLRLPRGLRTRHSRGCRPTATAGRNNLASALRSARSALEKRWLWRHRRLPLGDLLATPSLVLVSHFQHRARRTERRGRRADRIATCGRGDLGSMGVPHVRSGCAADGQGQSGQDSTAVSGFAVVAERQYTAAASDNGRVCS